MLSAYLAIHVALLFAAKDTAPITDAQIVGTWKSSCKDCFDVHGTGWIAYHTDHTCTQKSYVEEGPIFAHGTWKLRGRELTTRFGKLVVHETILRVVPTQFKSRAKIGDEVKIFTYTRVKPE